MSAIETTSTLPPRLSVVVLAFNEAANLPSVCHEILAVLSGMAIPAEVVVVNDGSTDQTGAIADVLVRDHDLTGQATVLRVIHHPINLGLGGGYRTGFTAARGEFLTFFPADGQFPATIIPAFLREMARADMVLGYIPDRRSSLVAKGLSFAERALYRAMFGKLPKFQGIMMFRTAILRDVRLDSTGRGWAVVMELIIRVSRGPYRVVSVANALRPRLSGESKVNNLRTIAANLRQVMALARHL
jgi:glycosyltransferase involved in cell wall biosynthesis